VWADAPKRPKVSKIPKIPKIPQPVSRGQRTSSAESDMKTETNRQPGADAKRPYTPPRLRTIELVADEVLAVGCKTVAGAPGPTGGNLTCRAPSVCFVPGS